MREGKCENYKFLHVENVGHNNILSSIFQEEIRREILDFSLEIM